ncbi:MBL fold metallo-hydrolase [Halobacteria archaeon AArc-curdl1]|uniref:MBL fold metallo-hydrolase n=1 Tax=Natronosalvus hydrolyticus TaxID=2979988 RepID=A0AAP2Z677_9EURY|nr:MBL fold metallo-hydrolase [Halobacteria archaeon AArc-curdl1]
MPEITPEKLGNRLFDSQEPPLILDIRHSDEFEEWHIPGSTNIDVYDELKKDAEVARTQLSELPADQDIVTVCAAGGVSQKATDLLKEMGRDALTLVDGMNGWSRVHRSASVDIDIDGELLQVARPGKGCLSYILISNGEAAVFDPSHYPEEYEKRLEGEGAELISVFDTHAHADHVSGGRDLADRNDVPYHLHSADATSLDATSLEDGQQFTIGTVSVEVIPTPGHSPGGVTYAVGNDGLVTGDTLFHKSVGRVELGVEAGIEDTDVEENAATLYESLQRLRHRSGNPLILPAHDPGSPEPPVRKRLSQVEAQNDDLGRDRDSLIEDLASDIPDHPPNFQRVKRVNIGDESVDDDELSSLELGPNRCAAE